MVSGPVILVPEKPLTLAIRRSESVFSMWIGAFMARSGGRKSFSELVELGRREHWIVEPHQLCCLS